MSLVINYVISFISLSLWTFFCLQDIKNHLSSSIYSWNLFIYGFHCSITIYTLHIHRHCNKHTQTHAQRVSTLKRVEEMAPPAYIFEHKTYWNHISSNFLSIIPRPTRKNRYQQLSVGLRPLQGGIRHELNNWIYT